MKYLKIIGDFLWKYFIVIIGIGIAVGVITLIIIE